MTTVARLMSWGMPLLYAGPAFALPLHCKGVGALYICLDGWMDIWLGRNRATCQSAYVGPGLEHLVSFQCERLACLYVEPGGHLEQSILRRMRTERHGVRLDHEPRDEIVKLLEPKNPLSERNRDAIASAYGIVSTSGGLGDPRISGIVDTVLADPAERHFAHALAQRLRLSESRLRHAFRNDAGISFRRFRLWARMGSGLTLVSQGATLTRAAHEAGFSSSAHFSSAYRTLFGINPAAVVRANPMLTVSRGASLTRATPRPC